MKHFFLILTLIIFTLPAVAEDAVLDSVDLDSISLKGLDRSVKKAFEKTRQIIQQARKDKDENTEFEATSQWCMMLHNYDFLEAAKSCYFTLGKQETANAKWPYLYAKTSEKQAQAADAVMGYKETLKRNSSYLPAYYHLIEMQRQAGNLKSAFMLLQSVPVELNLMNPILKLTGDVYFDLQNYHVAIGFYQQVLQKTPEAAALNYKVAQAYLALENQELAEKHMAQSNSIGITVQDPYFQDVKNQTVGEVPFLIQAKKAFQFEKYDEAIKNYQKALEYNPDSESGMVNLAVSYFKNQQIERSKTLFQQVLDKNPMQKTALFNLASIALSENRLLEATTLYQRYYALDSSDQTVRDKLIGLYQYNNQHEKIVKMIVDGNLEADEKYQKQLPKSYIQLGQYPKAIGVLESTLKKTPNDIPTLLSLAKIYSQAPDQAVKDAKKSLSYAEQAFELHKNTQTYWQLIHALDESKKCKKLEKTIKDFAITVNTEVSEVRKELNKQKNNQANCR